MHVGRSWVIWRAHPQQRSRALASGRKRSSNGRALQALSSGRKGGSATSRRCCSVSRRGRSVGLSVLSWLHSRVIL